MNEDRWKNTMGHPMDQLYNNKSVRCIYLACFLVAGNAGERVDPALEY